MVEKVTSVNSVRQIQVESCEINLMLRRVAERVFFVIQPREKPRTIYGNRLPRDTQVEKG